jgi:hypothetical protein
MRWRSGGSVIPGNILPAPGMPAAVTMLRSWEPRRREGEQMQTRTIGPVTVSAIGLGGMPMSIEGRPDEARSVRTIHAALDAGVTLIDTADAYHLNPGEPGHNERLIAKALASYPGDTSNVLVATRAATCGPATGPGRSTGPPRTCGRRSSLLQGPGGRRDRPGHAQPCRAQVDVLDAQTARKRSDVRCRPRTRMRWRSGGSVIPDNILPAPGMPAVTVMIVVVGTLSTFLGGRWHTDHIRPAQRGGGLG